MWCQDNNLSLYVSKTKELIVDYRKRRAEPAPINIDGAVVERVESFKFLGVHINNELSWSKHTKTGVMKRAWENPITTQETEKIWHGSSDPQRFYSCTIESILTGCITAWYGNCSASDLKALKRLVRTAQCITVAIQGLYTRRCQRKALKIVKDSSHPTHQLFSLLPHGKRYRRAKSRSKRVLNSFYPQAIRLLNT